MTYSELVALIDREIAARPWIGEPTCAHTHHGSYHCGERGCPNYIGSSYREAL